MNKNILLFIKITFIFIFCFMFCIYGQLTPTQDGLHYYYLTNHFFNEQQFNNHYFSPSGEEIRSPYPPGSSLIFGSVYCLLRLIPPLHIYDITPYPLSDVDYMRLLGDTSYSLSMPQLIFGQSQHQYNDLILLSMFCTSLFFFIMGLYFSIKIIARYTTKQSQFWLWLLALANPLIFFNVFYLFNWATFITFGVYAWVFYIFIRIEEDNKNEGFLLGCLLGSLFLIRYEFGLLTLGLLVYYTFKKHWHILIKIILGFLPFLGILGLYNYHSTGTLLSFSYFAVRKKTEMGISFQALYDFFINPQSGVFWHDFILCAGICGMCFLSPPKLRSFLWSSLLVCAIYALRSTGDIPSVLLFFAWTRYLIPFLPIAALGLSFWQNKYPFMGFVFFIAMAISFFISPWREAFHPALNTQQFTQKLRQPDFFDIPLTKQLINNTDHMFIAQAGSNNGYLVGRNKSNGIVFAAQITEISGKYRLQGVFMLHTPEYFTKIY